MTTLEVVAGDAVTGTLFTHRGRTESATFSYSAAYLARADAWSWDPDLPLRAGSQQTPIGRPLFGALSDSSPDRWGRRILDRREAALARAEGRTPRRLAEVDYLLGVRDDLRQGALRLRTEGGAFLADEDSGIPLLTDLPSLLSLAERAEDEDVALPDLQRLVRVGSSLGGARPKAHVLDTAGRVSIAKFPSFRSDTWDVMAWEKVALELARRAGVDVPESQLLTLAGRHVLVLQRFDRTAAGNRIGYASALTMLSAKDGDERSHVDLAAVVETVSSRAGDELEQLWRRLVFSVAIRNTDNHLRNHGFLHVRGDVWRLAPAFDLNPDPSPGDTCLATGVEGSDAPDTVAGALSVAALFRLPVARARSVAHEVLTAVQSWREVARRLGLSPSACAAMAPAFAEVG